jgi:hypothetical protein
MVATDPPPFLGVKSAAWAAPMASPEKTRAKAIWITKIRTRVSSSGRASAWARSNACSTNQTASDAQRSHGETVDVMGRDPCEIPGAGR